MKMNVYSSLILWVLDYLTFRPQFVRFSHLIQSKQSYHFFFSLLYSSDCISEHDDCIIDKYADDIVLTELTTSDQDLSSREEMKSFVDWCDRNHLVKL